MIYLKQLKSGNWKKSDLWNYDIVLEVDELEEWWKNKTGKVITLITILGRMLL